MYIIPIFNKKGTTNMIHFDCDNIFSFKLPENLLKEINNLEVAINNNESYMDQEPIRRT